MESQQDRPCENAVCQRPDKPRQSFFFFSAGEQTATHRNERQDCVHLIKQIRENGVGKYPNDRNHSICSNKRPISLIGPSETFTYYRVTERGDSGYRADGWKDVYHPVARNCEVRREVYKTSERPHTPRAGVNLIAGYSVVYPVSVQLRRSGRKAKNDGNRYDIHLNPLLALR